MPTVMERARSVGRAEKNEPVGFNAPLFRTLVEKLGPNRRWVVLDLGAACTQTIALFGSPGMSRAGTPNPRSRIRMISRIPRKMSV